MAAQDASEFDFYLGFAKPLVLNLPEPKDRVLAAAWIQKLQDSSCGSAKLRADYLKLLLFVLQRKALAKPFSEHPNLHEKLQEFPASQKLQDVAKELILAEGKKGDVGPSGDYPPYTTEYSADLLEYSAAQDIPNFGVQVYYAISREPLTTWNKADKGIFPKAAVSQTDRSEAPLASVVSVAISKSRPRTPTATRSRSASGSRAESRSRDRAPREVPSTSTERSPRARIITPPVSPLGAPPPVDDRTPPSWGSNLIEVIDPPKKEDIVAERVSRGVLLPQEEEESFALGKPPSVAGGVPSPPSYTVQGPFEYHEPYSPLGDVSFEAPPSPTVSPLRMDHSFETPARVQAAGQAGRTDAAYEEDFRELEAMVPQVQVSQRDYGEISPVKPLTPPRDIEIRKLLKKEVKVERRSGPGAKGPTKPKKSAVPPKKPPLPPPKKKSPSPKLMSKIPPPGSKLVQPGGSRLPQPGGSRLPQPGGSRIPQPGGSRIPQPGGSRVPARPGTRLPGLKRPPPKGTREFEEFKMLGMGAEGLDDDTLGYEDFDLSGVYDTSMEGEIAQQDAEFAEWERQLSQLEAEVAGDEAELRAQGISTSPDRSVVTPSRYPAVGDLSAASLPYRTPPMIYPDFADLSAPSLPYRTPTPPRRTPAGYDMQELQELGITEADLRDISIPEDEPFEMSGESPSPGDISVSSETARQNAEFDDWERQLAALEAECEEDIDAYGLSPSVSPAPSSPRSPQRSPPRSPPRYPDIGDLSAASLPYLTPPLPQPKRAPTPPRIGTGMPSTSGIPRRGIPTRGGIPRRKTVKKTIVTKTESIPDASPAGIVTPSRYPAIGDLSPASLPYRTPPMIYPDYADLSAPSLPYRTPTPPRRTPAGYDVQELQELGITEADLRDISMPEDEPFEVSGGSPAPGDISVSSETARQDVEFDEWERQLAALEAECQEDIDAYGLSPLASPVPPSPRSPPRSPPRYPGIGDLSAASLPYATPPPRSPGYQQQRQLEQVGQLYDTLRPGARQRAEMTPPVFSRHGEIREAAAGLRYTPGQFGVAPDEQFQGGPEFFAGTTEFSPYVDRRKPIGEVMPGLRHFRREALQDEDFPEEMEEVERVSPLRRRRDAMESVVEGILDLRSSPAAAGLPMTTPARSPSPRRSLGFFDDEFLMGDMDMDDMFTSPIAFDDTHSPYRSLSPESRRYRMMEDVFVTPEERRIPRGSPRSAAAISGLAQQQYEQLMRESPREERAVILPTSLSPQAMSPRRPTPPRPGSPRSPVDLFGVPGAVPWDAPVTHMDVEIPSHLPQPLTPTNRRQGLLGFTTPERMRPQRRREPPPPAIQLQYDPRLLSGVSMREEVFPEADLLPEEEYVPLTTEMPGFGIDQDIPEPYSSPPRVDDIFSAPPPLDAMLDVSPPLREILEAHQLTETFMDPSRPSMTKIVKSGSFTRRLLRRSGPPGVSPVSERPELPPERYGLPSPVRVTGIPSTQSYKIPKFVPGAPYQQQLPILPPAEEAQIRHLIPAERQEFYRRASQLVQDVDDGTAQPDYGQIRSPEMPPMSPTSVSPLAVMTPPKFEELLSPVSGGSPPSRLSPMREVSEMQFVSPTAIMTERPRPAELLPSPVAGPSRVRSPVAGPSWARSPEAGPSWARSPVAGPSWARSPEAGPPSPVAGPSWMTSPAARPSRMASPMAGPSKQRRRDDTLMSEKPPPEFDLSPKSPVRPPRSPPKEYSPISPPFDSFDLVRKLIFRTPYTKRKDQIAINQGTNRGMRIMERHSRPPPLHRISEVPDYYDEENLPFRTTVDLTPGQITRREMKIGKRTLQRRSVGPALSPLQEHIEYPDTPTTSRPQAGKGRARRRLDFRQPAPKAIRFQGASPPREAVDWRRDIYDPQPLTPPGRVEQAVRQSQLYLSPDRADHPEDLLGAMGPTDWGVQQTLLDSSMPDRLPSPMRPRPQQSLPGWETPERLRRPKPKPASPNILRYHPEKVQQLDYETLTDEAMMSPEAQGYVPLGTEMPGFGFGESPPRLSPPRRGETPSPFVRAGVPSPYLSPRTPLGTPTGRRRPSDMFMTGRDLLDEEFNDLASPRTPPYPDYADLSAPSLPYQTPPMVYPDYADLSAPSLPYQTPPMIYPDYADLSAPSLPYRTPTPPRRTPTGYDMEDLEELGITEADLRDISIPDDEPFELSGGTPPPGDTSVSSEIARQDAEFDQMERELAALEAELEEDLRQAGGTPSPRSPAPTSPRSSPVTRSPPSESRPPASPLSESRRYLPTSPRPRSPAQIPVEEVAQRQYDELMRSPASGPPPRQQTLSGSRRYLPTLSRQPPSPVERDLPDYYFEGDTYRIEPVKIRSQIPTTSMDQTTPKRAQRTGRAALHRRRLTFDEPPDEQPDEDRFDRYLREAEEAGIRVSPTPGTSRAGAPPIELELGEMYSSMAANQRGLGVDETWEPQEIWGYRSPEASPTRPSTSVSQPPSPTVEITRFEQIQEFDTGEEIFGEAPLTPPGSPVFEGPPTPPRLLPYDALEGPGSPSYSPTQIRQAVEQHQYTKHHADRAREHMTKRLQVGARSIPLRGSTRPRLIPMVEADREESPRRRSPVREDVFVPITPPRLQDSMEATTSHIQRVAEQQYGSLADTPPRVRKVTSVTSETEYRVVEPEAAEVERARPLFDRYDLDARALPAGLLDPNILGWQSPPRSARETRQTTEVPHFTGVQLSPQRELAQAALLEGIAEEGILYDDVPPELYGSPGAQPDYGEETFMGIEDMDGRLLDTTPPLSPLDYSSPARVSPRLSPVSPVSPDFMRRVQQHQYTEEFFDPERPKATRTVMSGKRRVFLHQPSLAPSLHPITEPSPRSPRIPPPALHRGTPPSAEKHYVESELPSPQRFEQYRPPSRLLSPGSPKRRPEVRRMSGRRLDFDRIPTPSPPRAVARPLPSPVAGPSSASQPWVSPVASPASASPRRISPQTPRSPSSPRVTTSTSYTVRPVTPFIKQITKKTETIIEEEEEEEDPFLPYVQDYEIGEAFGGRTSPGILDTSEINEDDVDIGM